MGYYNKNQGKLQQNLNIYYCSESADTLCEQFNRFINTFKKERKEEMQEKYPWLDPSDERKYMSDKEILDKYVTDRSPFFIRSYDIKAEDKKILDKEMNRLLYLGILKKDFQLILVQLC